MIDAIIADILYVLFGVFFMLLLCIFALLIERIIRAAHELKAVSEAAKHRARTVSDFLDVFEAHLDLCEEDVLNFYEMYDADCIPEADKQYKDGLLYAYHRVHELLAEYEQGQWEEFE